MARVGYAQAREDHEYLWSIAQADDMTGGYVDQNDLYLLLKTPTKATARDCYCSQIAHWFSVGPDQHAAPGTWQEWIERDPRIREIAIRHGFIEAGDTP